MTNYSNPTTEEYFRAFGAPMLEHNLNRVTVKRSRPVRLPDGQGGSDEDLEYSKFSQIKCDPIIHDSRMSLSLPAEADVKVGDLILIENL
ncbi:MAG TPA: hypothetical protein PKW18_13850 [Candidatus Sumerlaeota bacterium]|nr:MAG: hypothetical protein BWY90_00059 [Deltaproteobacteria bacterium ADurb.BinA014]HOE64649.1 hypothetical protein [Candidatus Sumerlaeota bacterium]HOR65954.1 hypothetical protein [Candidatus Sumerlaeota bacterium]HPL75638.1 hypothetical protein [Candidatus Sumerlaeota bacterium]HRR31987.1 hypothetical protein [Candidatus Sumerlaeia bacterium]